MEIPLTIPEEVVAEIDLKESLLSSSLKDALRLQ